MILIDKLGIQSGKFRLQDVTFEIPSGGYGVLMGKTGSGKTTILEAIAGLRSVTAGRIVLGDIDATCRKPAERNIGFVPQDGALFSMMSVRDHLAFALVVRGAARADVAATVARMAELLEIGHLLDRTPERLSGGERQRVALGRALAFKPATLCLDEPLAALDDDTRDQMMELLKRIQHETGVTTLHITHNRREAAALADVLLELIDGKVRRITASRSDTNGCRF